jgi:hypothetical protein
MNSSDHDQVRENLLIEGLQDWVYLGEVHTAFMYAGGHTPMRPLHEAQKLTLNMIRELVSDGLFVLGMPSGKRSNPGFTQWDLPLDAAIAKIEDAYVKHFGEPRNWTNVVWMDLTDKGEKLALELYHADEPGP